MAMTTGWATVVHRSQGAKLWCWYSCLEMLMQWKRQNIHGTGDRTEHTQEVKDAYAKNRGYSLVTLQKDYALKNVNGLNESIDSWKKALGISPVILCGKYGLARVGIGGHVIIAIGMLGQDKIVYLDPF
jgi:hypothetical protein